MSNWPPKKSSTAPEAASPWWGRALFAHALVFLPAFTLSEGLDLPLLTLIFAFQVLVCCSTVVYPPEAKDSKSPAVKAPVKVIPAPDTFSQASLQERYTKRFERNESRVEHVTKVLGYPKKLIEGDWFNPCRDSCGAACPFKAAHIGEFEGKTVVDFGSGAGQDCFIANRLGASKVVGLDFNEKGVEVATIHAGKLGVSKDKVSFKLQKIDGDLKELGLKADIVMSNGVINLCSAKSKVFKNAYEILKPGGIFLFADVISLAPQVAPSWQKAREEALAKWILGCVSQSKNERLMQEAGFAVNFIGFSDFYTSDKTRGALFRATKKKIAPPAGGSSA